MLLFLRKLKHLKKLQFYAIEFFYCIYDQLGMEKQNLQFLIYVMLDVSMLDYLKKKFIEIRKSNIIQFFCSLFENY